MLRRLAQLEFAVAALLLAAIVLLVFVAAVMRFFGHPLIWSVDLAQLLFIWLCFHRRHARHAPERRISASTFWCAACRYRCRLVVEMRCRFVMLVFLGILAVEGYKLTHAQPCSASSATAASPTPG